MNIDLVTTSRRSVIFQRGQTSRQYHPQWQSRTRLAQVINNLIDKGTWQYRTDKDGWFAYRVDADNYVQRRLI